MCYRLGKPYHWLAGSSFSVFSFIHSPPFQLSHSCFSLLLRGSIPWRGGQAFSCSAVSGLRSVQPIPSSVHLHSQIWSPVDHSCTSIIQPKSSGICNGVQPLLFVTGCTTALPAAEVQTSRGCGALLADTHIVDRQRMPACECLVSPCPLGHQPTSGLRAVQPLEAQGAAMQVTVTRG